MAPHEAASTIVVLEVEKLLASNISECIIIEPDKQCNYSVSTVVTANLGWIIMQLLVVEL